ncbi:hypothetical protein MCOR02_004865 [Pyricularia oryzae]|uniref:Uncharacterized protein n=1 Tax=Pyricularia grisea TaxID=148305 RepID=A0ABQ8NHL4_PYRGI|nr:hypothetical protein MCOR01_006601 [Pyricularia oryzae]KAI6296684.1 hypothetical protein MCOR33_006799 [Pyricularia grisea]KAH9435955.1 hypothetical protein MCOR02_004865 [Pyricularia oryzae]KAI6311864.1 hypothetical protein MCOR34_005861 [Pyricularia oryzae]KAI6325442.1 hypothetical protein MCOR30_006787 [Pyricularia oryzae]
MNLWVAGALTKGSDRCCSPPRQSKSSGESCRLRKKGVSSILHCCESSTLQRPNSQPRETPSSTCVNLTNPFANPTKQLPGRHAALHSIPRRRLTDLAVPAAGDSRSVRVDQELEGARIERVLLVEKGCSLGGFI